MACSGRNTIPGGVTPDSGDFSAHRKKKTTGDEILQIIRSFEEHQSGTLSTKTRKRHEHPPPEFVTPVFCISSRQIITHENCGIHRTLNGFKVNSNEHDFWNISLRSRGPPSCVKCLPFVLHFWLLWTLNYENVDPFTTELLLELQIWRIHANYTRQNIKVPPGGLHDC